MGLSGAGGSSRASRRATRQAGRPGPRVPSLIPRKLIVLAVAPAMILAAYAAAGFWLVPRIIRSQAERFADENYQRPLAISEIRFNPFTFELAVDGFSF